MMVIKSLTKLNHYLIAQSFRPLNEAPILYKIDGRISVVLLLFPSEIV